MTLFYKLRISTNEIFFVLFVAFATIVLAGYLVPERKAMPCCTPADYKKGKHTLSFADVMIFFISVYLLIRVSEKCKNILFLLLKRREIFVFFF